MLSAGARARASAVRRRPPDRDADRELKAAAHRGGIGALLALQRSAGNRAVVRLLTEGGMPVAPWPRVVQRDPKQPARVDPKAEDAKALKAMKTAFSYPFWLLPEGKSVKPGAGGDAVVLVNGVRIRFLPDRILTEAEYSAEGRTFANEHGSSGAITTFSYAGMDWDPKSVRTDDLGGGNFMVNDYTEPVTEIAVRTTYRQSRTVPDLATARALISGYGKGRLLQDHEASHAADVVAYAREKGPRLPDERGASMSDLNAALQAYFTASRQAGSDIGTFSRARTDCPGSRNATFCVVRKKH